MEPWRDTNMYRPHAFPVSIKGVCVRDGCVLLMRNERDEWELPGGKLDLGEDPAMCVGREISEETGWNVRVGPILDSWQYHIRDGVDVLIVTYGCFIDNDSPVQVTRAQGGRAIQSPGRAGRTPPTDKGREMAAIKRAYEPGRGQCQARTPCQRK